MTNHRLKIIHLITGLEKGGAESMLAQLIPRMDKQRFDNIVVSLTQDGPIGNEIRRKGGRTHIINMSRSSPSPAAFWRLYTLMRREQPAVVQTWLYHADFFGLISAWLARVQTIAWNIRCTDMDERYKQGFNRIFLRVLSKLSRFPDVVVVNSRAGRDFHTKLGYRPKKWLILENGFDLEKFRPDPEARNALCRELGVPDTDRLIGLIARKDPIKDHQTFLRAAAHLATENPNVRFILVGAGVDETSLELTTTINMLQLNSKVHLLGPRNDIPRLTAGLDIGTCCSVSEGFPNIVGEAMACGVPCVVTDVGDAARIVGDCGIVVPPGDPKALANGWQQLLRLEGSCLDEIGRRALSRIATCYSIEQCIERYQALYAGLTQKPKA